MPDKLTGFYGEITKDRSLLSFDYCGLSFSIVSGLYLC